MGKRSKRNKKINEISVPENTSALMDFNFFKLLKSNLVFLVFVMLLAFGAYSNSLDNEFTLIDDFQGIVENENIRDLKLNLRNKSLIPILQATIYHFYGLDTTPYRVLSVGLHLTVTFLVFFIISALFGKKYAYIATLVFAVHPINTEAVTWISGMPYLVGALVQFSMFLLYLLYKKSGKKTYIYISATIFAICLFTLNNIWLLVVPVVLVIIDQFIIEQNFNLKKLWWLYLFLIPLSFYVVSVFRDQFAFRMQYRAGGETNRVAVNQQQLTPVLEGWPYSITLMSQLYLFPKDLTLYYDGKLLITPYYIFMYLFFITYVGYTLFLIKKNRQLAGVFILFPVLVAPMLSPIKVTWFLAERYLYSGTAFFGYLVALTFYWVKDKLKKEYIAYFVLGIYLALLGVRTYYRNMDWQSTKTISESNIKVAPLSVRPYNDMGSYYYYKGDLSQAVSWYEKALEVYPYSGTAMNNLGYIYMQEGPLIFRKDYIQQETDAQKAIIYYKNAIKWINNQELRAASFLLNKAVSFDPTNTEIVNFTADYYAKYNLKAEASKLYNLALKSDPQNEYAKTRLEELFIR